MDEHTGPDGNPQTEADFPVFLKPLGNNLIFPALVLVAAACAVPEARATVVFSQQDLSVYQGVEEDLSPWLQVDPAEVARESSLGGMSSLPIVPTEEERHREQQAENLFRTLRGAHMTQAAGMSPSPATSLAPAGGSSGGFAVPSELVIPPPAALQASLPPEARTILPAGPPWRWFRPPRTISSVLV